MIDCGRTFRSKAEMAPRVPAGPARRPLSSTRVRLAPRPRSETVSVPTPPSVTKAEEIAEVIWAEPAAIGEFWSISEVLNRPWARDSSGLITVTGSGLLNSVRRMREPVTMIVSLLSLASGALEAASGCSTCSGVGAASCAKAGPARTRAEMPVALHSAALMREVFTICQSLFIWRGANRISVRPWSGFSCAGGKCDKSHQRDSRLLAPVRLDFN